MPFIHHGFVLVPGLLCLKVPDWFVQVWGLNL